MGCSVGFQRRGREAMHVTAPLSGYLPACFCQLAFGRADAHVAFEDVTLEDGGEWVAERRHGTASEQQSSSPLWTLPSAPAVLLVASDPASPSKLPTTHLSCHFSETRLSPHCDYVGLHAINISTSPFPGFPTDLQPQFCTALALAPGNSIVTEMLFEGRMRFDCAFQFWFGCDGAQLRGGEEDVGTGDGRGKRTRGGAAED